MAMYLKDNQQRSSLQSKVSRDLDKRLVKKSKPHKAKKASVKEHVVDAQHAVLSLRGAWFTVLVTGGCVSILIALLERENPAAIDGNLEARTLALLGVSAIILGLLGLLIGKILDNRRRGHSG